MKYLPFLANNRYEVVAGLRPIRQERVFDIDSQWSSYRQQKLEVVAKKNNTSLYAPADAGLSLEEKEAVNLFFMQKLATEYPESFLLDEKFFHSKLTNEKLELHQGIDHFAALSMMVQEDIAIWKLDRVAEKEWLAALYVCFPSGWDPSEKIGHSFAHVHAPVVDIKPITQKSWAMVESMVQRGPFTRQVWGISFDQVLDHHPETLKKLPGFNPAAPRVYVRSERQTIHPFEALGLSLFTIRTYLYDVTTLNREELASLVEAVENMTPDQLRYKGFYESRDAVLSYLKSI